MNSRNIASKDSRTILLPNMHKDWLNRTWKNMKNYLRLALLILPIAGCAPQTLVVKDEPAYNPSQHARVRFQDIHQVYFGRTCESKFITIRSVMYDESEKRIGFGGLGLNPQSKRIGMPFVTGYSETHGIIPHRKIFHEVVIPVDKPITLAASVSQSVAGGSITCGPVITRFLPEAGKDYDAVMHLQGGRCFITVDNLVHKDDKVLAIPVRTEKPATATPGNEPAECAGLVTGPKAEEKSY